MKTIILLLISASLWAQSVGSGISQAGGGGGGGGNTTSTGLVDGNLPVATGANAIGDSGIAPGNVVQSANGTSGAFTDTTTTGNYLPSVTQRLLPPGGFQWQTEPAVIFSGPGGVGTTFDVSNLQSRPVVHTYYVALTGSDSNACTTSGLPCATISKAVSLGIGANTTIHVAAGWYNSAAGPNGPNASFGPQENVNFICDSPQQCILSSDIVAPSFSAVGSHYEAPETSTITQVIDTAHLDSYSIYSQLTQVGSSATVDSTPNTYYWASNVLYVHLSDGRAPDSSVKYYKPSAYAFWGTYPVTTYFQDFLVVGGDNPIFTHCAEAGCTGGAVTTTIAKNVNIWLSSISSGATMLIQGNTGGPSYQYSQNVKIQESAQDFFSCDSVTSWANGTYVMEINDTAINSVWPSTASSPSNVYNGSTSHGNCAVIRVGGLYGNTYGPVLADVGLAQGWNIGTTITASSDTASANIAATAAATGASYEWIYSVNNQSVAASATAYASQNSPFYVQFPIGSQTTNSASQLYSYVNPTSPMTPIVPAQGFSTTGNITVTGVDTPASLTIATAGTAGSTTYNYSVVACTQDGSCSAAATTTIGTGNATLSSTNYNTLTWTAGTVANYWKIYRTLGGGTTGFIGVAYSGTYSDFGQFADGTSPSTPPSQITVKDNGVTVNIGNFGCVSGFAGINFSTTPSCSNYAFLSDGSNGTLLNGATINLRIGNVTKWTIDSGGNLFNAAATFQVTQAGAATTATVQVGGFSGPTWGTGAATPGTCIVGSLFSVVTGGVGTLYLCTAANTWTPK